MMLRICSQKHELTWRLKIWATRPMDNKDKQLATMSSEEFQVRMLMVCPEILATAQESLTRCMTCHAWNTSKVSASLNAAPVANFNAASGANLLVHVPHFIEATRRMHEELSSAVSMASGKSWDALFETHSRLIQSHEALVRRELNIICRL